LFRRILILLFLTPIAALAREPAVWQVGPDRPLKLPSEAAQLAQHGDTVTIDAGLYLNDYAVWHQDNLSIRGTGGFAHLHSNTLIPNGKGIWVINGQNTLIENLEFSGAKVRSTNGAGIRHQGGDLTLRNTFFHDNEFSILSGVNRAARIDVRNSRFWFQRRATRFSHGIYIGEAGRLTLIGNHFTGTDQGHQLKSRALENYILYNRIEESPGGNSSRLIDLPNCGFSVVLGNDLHQGAGTNNRNAIGYGMEGCANRTPLQTQLYVLNNTFLNDALTATVVSNRANGWALVANNILRGNGNWLYGKGEASNNLREARTPLEARRWDLEPGSAAIDSAASTPEMPAAMPFPLVPEHQFSPPAGTVPRPRQGRLDIGAREWTAPSVQ